jgi:hypothetical protein
MLLVLLIIALSSNSSKHKNIRKSLRKISSKMSVKPKEDECIDEDDEPREGLEDSQGCAAAYVALYKKLPSETALSTELAAYKTACKATECGSTGCYDLVIDATPTDYDNTFKSAFKTNCIPPNAASVKIDTCTKGDDTKATDLENAEGCNKAYDDLIALLPVVSNRKKSNKTLLDGEAAAVTEFVAKCPKTICAADSCYAALILTTPTVYDDTLKETITSDCKPPAQEEKKDNDSISAISVNRLFLLVPILLLIFDFWI